MFKWHTLYKRPGGHPILYLGLKLNWKISAEKYKTSYIHRGQLIFPWGAKQKLHEKWRDSKNAMLFRPKSKAQGKHLSIWIWWFDGQLSNILFTYLCLCVRVLRVAGLLLGPNSKTQGECNTSYIGGTIGGDYFETYGWRGAWMVYENAKFSMKIKWNNSFQEECELLWWYELISKVWMEVMTTGWGYERRWIG